VRWALGPPFGDERPWLPASCEQTARLFIAALPCFRIAGGMGATHYHEGFERHQVEALFRLEGLTPDEQRQAWPLLLDMEREMRSLLSEQRAEADAQRQQEKEQKEGAVRLGRGKTLHGLIS